MEKTEYTPGETPPKKAGAAVSAYLNAANGFNTAPKTGVVPEKEADTATKTSTAPEKTADTAVKTSTVPEKAADTAVKTSTAPEKAADTVAKTSTVPEKAADTAVKTSTVPEKAADTAAKTSTVPKKAADTVAKKSDASVKKADIAPAPPKAAEKSAAPQKTAVTGAAPKPQEHLSDSEVIKRTAGVWRYREITDDGTEMHSETHTKHTRTDHADIIAARVRGKKHKHDGTNCDDYFETAVTEDCVICVVCDGAGSRRLSRIGSRVCCETAASYLKKELSALFKGDTGLKKQLSADMTAPEFLDGCGKVAALVRESAGTAYAALENTFNTLKENAKYTNALGRAVQIGDLAATFLTAVVVPLMINGKRQALTVSVQIGDGCICTIDTKADADSCFRLMGEADSGAFSGETDFLSEKNIRPEIIGGKTRVARSAADLVMLMTDGVADDYFPAQPMMKRLYLDLCLNGILPMNGELTSAEDPPPVFYSSVSMGRRSVALQYAKQLLSDGGRKEMDGLWEKRDMLRCHSLEAYRMNIGDTPEERLCVWLDNYNERGSFDDRTLAIIRLSDFAANGAG